VDGHEYGRTPVAVHDLARGTHRVRIAHDGYSTEERRIVLSESRPSQSMVVPLTRTRVAQVVPPVERKARTESSAAATDFAGALTVDSRPVGARVYLDGRLVGTTPLQVPQVAAGEHAVRIEHDGYRHWTSSVRIIATETNRVTASLER
jgi:hemin uptake protein HemP